MVDSEGKEVTQAKKMSRKEEKAILKEDEAREKELELGVKLKRLKNGAAKIPRVRSAAQLENDKRFVIKNQERRETARLKKLSDKSVTRKTSLIDALKEVIRLPVKTLQEEPKIIVPKTKSFSEW